LPTVELFNLGMKAQQLSQQIGPDFAQTVAPLLATSPYGPSRTAILWQSGTNDIGIGGRSAAQITTDSAQAVRISRSALRGVRILRTTLLPRSDRGWTAGRVSDGMSREATRHTVNAAWRSGASGADVLLDIGDPASIMGAPGAPEDLSAHAAPGLPDRASLYVDRLHPSSVGYASGLWQALAAGLRSQLGQ
jgi:lysophospholipase L1-like esterase